MKETERLRLCLEKWLAQAKCEDNHELLEETARVLGHELVTMADVLVILAGCVNEFADEKRYQEADGLDAHPVDCVCRLCRAEPLARAILGEEK